MKYKKIALLAVFVFITGCASQQPQMTRQEWLDTTTKTYKNTSKDDVINAAEKVLRLADGGDFKIVHSEEGFRASRYWTIYLVIAATMGTDQWALSVKQENDDVRASLQVNTQAQAITPMATTSGDMTVTTGPMSGSPIMGTSVYDVFWARLDYMLGQSDHWMTCEESNKRVSDKVVWGANDSLCNSFNMKDALPEDYAEK